MRLPVRRIGRPARYFVFFASAEHVPAPQLAWPAPAFDGGFLPVFFFAVFVSVAAVAVASDGGVVVAGPVAGGVVGVAAAAGAGVSAGAGAAAGTGVGSAAGAVAGATCVALVLAGV